jgi:DNA processing protein
MTEEQYILTLLAIPGIGRKIVRSILNLHHKPPGTRDILLDVLRASQEANCRVPLPSAAQLDVAERIAHAILKVTTDMAITILPLGHPAFPERLRNISDPPVILYAKGNIAALNRKASVAIIGTREPSEYGERIAEKFGAIFANKKFVVISGLAIGCDSWAHLGCLSVSGETVGVLAHGLDTVYPAKNRPLTKEILEKGGCLISEYPPGERPRRNYFIERDRLQSGLSAGVIVVETDIKGGTMHTVRFCHEQGRHLACLAHPFKYSQHPKANGNKFLIEEKGAIALSTPEDVDRFADLLLGNIQPQEDAVVEKHNEPQLSMSLEV